MRLHRFFFIKVAISGLLLFPQVALAADGATLVFKSGQVVTIDDGFKDMVEAMRDLNNRSSDHKIVQLSIGGGTFLLNIAEVVVLCRDDCKSLNIVDKRDPSRGRR